MRSGFTKSERVAASEAESIIELLTHGFINEYRPHYHYPVNCDHPDFRKGTGCLTSHPKHELHAVCLTCQQYLWGPKGEYPE